MRNIDEVTDFFISIEHTGDLPALLLPWHTPQIDEPLVALLYNKAPNITARKGHRQEIQLHCVNSSSPIGIGEILYYLLF